jgi:2-polyprenyl-3-methyl-5-hydroxy-6-metoxy-1,4-benzoquinol methylase
MATAYPKSSFVGVDPHAPSIERAREMAGAAGLTNARFFTTPVEQMAAGDPAGAKARDVGFDLIVAIDCVHDMIDPVQSLRAMRGLLAETGVIFWSEPTGSRAPGENRGPQEKLRANLSPFHCLTVSLAAGGAGLGTIIGEAGARELAEQAGFAALEKLAIESPVQQFFLLRARP